MSQLPIVLGDVVRNARKKKNLSQEALAERIGVCKRTIVDIEKNNSNPKFEILFLLVRELDLPLQQVFYPDRINSFEAKTQLRQELEKCNEYESKIALAILESLLSSLRREAKDM